MNSHEINYHFATDKVPWKSIFKLCFKLVYVLSAKKHNVVVFFKLNWLSVISPIALNEALQPSPSMNFYSEFERVPLCLSFQLNPLQSKATFLRCRDINYSLLSLRS